MSNNDGAALFRDFLRAGTWTACENGQSADRHDFMRAVARCAAKLGPAQSGSQARLDVFCVTTAFEALVAYFVASELNLYANITSLNRAAQNLKGFSPDAVGRVIVPKGHKLREPIAHGEIVSLDFGFSRDEAEPPRLAAKPAGPGARLLYCTSGSTGVPKYVVCDESRLVANAGKVAAYLGLSRSDRTLCLFPITFMYGLSTTLCTLFSGGHIEYSNWASPSHIASLAADKDLNILPIIGDWAIELARAWRGQARAMPKVTVINASDRLLRTQAEHLLSISGRLWNNYGQTESGPRLLAAEIVSARQLDALCFGGVVAPGWPIDPGIKLEIRNRLTDDPSSPGELHYSSPFAMRGYLDAAGGLIERPEWLSSGDLFRQTESGLCQWVGRVAHSIKYNGSYLGVHTLLNQLLASDCVSAAAFQKSDRGELVLAVSSAQNREYVEKRVQEIAARELAGCRFKLEIVSSLPRTDSGKIDHQALRAYKFGELAAV